MRTPRERQMLFVRGFGDGAKSSAKKHADDVDYCEGYDQGRQALTEAALAYCKEYNLPLPSPLRAGENFVGENVVSQLVEKK